MGKFPDFSSPEIGRAENSESCVADTDPVKQKSRAPDWHAGQP
jgi:hypothetical protein